MKYIIFYFDNKVSKIFEEQTNEHGQKFMSLTSHYNFVSKYEIVARVVDIDDVEEIDSYIDEGYNYHTYQKYNPFKAGDGILFDQTDLVYRSKDYGFVKYDTNKTAIILLSPLRIQKDKMKAYYIIHPTKFGKIPAVEEIEENLTKLKIYTMVDKNTLTEDLKKIDTAKNQLHRVVVAQGKEPKNGYAEHFFPLIDFQKKAGKLLENGSIDFKEVGSIVEVKQRQAILKRVPGETPEDGYNIYGDKVTGEITDPGGYSVGDNIIPTIDENIYAASIDGCIEIIKKTISVSPVSFIKGDVNYDSGNIDFSGSVHVSGSVLPGFIVKAKGDVIIAKNVDDAVIEAGANVEVKLGIGGKGLSRITAGGNVKAKFVLNSNIEAMGSVEVEDSIINSEIFSNDKITVTDKHGKIIGGELTALYEIQAKISGVPKENKTILAVGKNIIIEMELAELRKQINELKEKIEEQTRKIKSSYGEEVFTNLKEFITILPPVKKKACIEAVTELSTLNKDLKELSIQYEAKENELKFDRDPAIEIIDKVYPGTLIKIKKSVRLIEELLRNVKFYEDPAEKVIRITSAN
ncbi:MAG: DUF342 domain-containing protein [Spirochaetes bacterium]|nr:DUF342 domain-containing protein [Spirochaetota bacterium]